MSVNHASYEFTTPVCFTKTTSTSKLSHDRSIMEGGGAGLTITAPAMPETRDHTFLNRCRLLKMPVSDAATCRLFASAKRNEDKLSPRPDGSIKASALTAWASSANWFFRKP